MGPAVGSGGTVRCSGPTQTTTDTNFTVVVNVPSTIPNGTILSTSTATVQSANVDPDATNNTLTITTTVVSPTAQANVGVTKIDTPDPVAIGHDISYTITVSNAGPATALNLTLTDTVPTGTTFRSIGSAQAWSCSTPAVGGTGAITCTLASLASGRSSVLILRVRVNALAGSESRPITNTATVTNAVTDPTPGNNSATTTTTVAAANTCPTPGKAGTPAGPITGAVNTYFPGSGTAAAGSTSITLGARNASGSATPIAVGDLVLIIQMQDAAINTTDTDAYGDGTAGDGEARGATNQNSTGRYEYAVAASAVPVGGGTLTLTSGLLNTYTTAAATTTLGQRTFQVIRVPQYVSATLSSGLTAAYWNGSSGGVLAVDVQGALALGGANVDLTGRGFRGGGGRGLGGQGGGTGTDYVSLATTAYHGSKGEGTAGTPRYVYDPVTQAVVDIGERYPTTSGSYARGAPGTAGGGGTDSNPDDNDQNSGGGGGGNGGLGGRGGNAWFSNAAVGGFGGAGIVDDAGLLTLGGGGGAGARNNSAGDESSGNAGGGIVMIRADSLTGAGTITTDGLSANTGDTTPDNDGGGGGGAGGSVLVYAPNGGFGGLTVNARGGRGSDAWPTIGPTSYPGERHGPGGGGGGGRVFLSGTPAAAVVTSGASGITSTTGEVYGASDGGPGTVSTDLTVIDIPGIDTTGSCSAFALSSVDLGITVTGPADPLDPCSSAAYVFPVTNGGPDTAIDSVASFPIPANTTFQSLASPAGWTCSTPARWRHRDRELHDAALPVRRVGQLHAQRPGELLSGARHGAEHHRQRLHDQHRHLRAQQHDRDVEPARLADFRADAGVAPRPAGARRRGARRVRDRLAAGDARLPRVPDGRPGREGRLDAAQRRDGARAAGRLADASPLLRPHRAGHRALPGDRGVGAQRAQEPAGPVPGGRPAARAAARAGREPARAHGRPGHGAHAALARARAEAARGAHPSAGGAAPRGAALAARGREPQDRDGRQWDRDGAAQPAAGTRAAIGRRALARQAHERRPQRRVPRDGSRPARGGALVRRLPARDALHEPERLRADVGRRRAASHGAAVARGRCAACDLRARGPAGRSTSRTCRGAPIRGSGTSCSRAPAPGRTTGIPTPASSTCRAGRPPAARCPCACASRA